MCMNKRNRKWFWFHIMSFNKPLW